MRQIILDTETTGLDARQGHRVIEIAAVEMVNRRLTGNHFHRYLNPDRDIDEGAMQVHGITGDFLQDKPRFGDIAGEFAEFVGGTELVIHNAPFDVGFLDAEFSLQGMRPLNSLVSGVIDTLAMARNLHPGQRNNLDALCKRYGIDNTNRTVHGALIDCELLAQVYLSMTRGQESLIMGAGSSSNAAPSAPGKPRASALRAAASREEADAHEQQLQAIDRESRGLCLWLQAGGK